MLATGLLSLSLRGYDLCPSHKVLPLVALISKLKGFAHISSEIMALFLLEVALLRARLSGVPYLLCQNPLKVQQKCPVVTCCSSLLDKLLDRTKMYHFQAST